ncbi:MAG TPA: hypothetical protein VH062_34735 [Polyangiaceae bacterium]|jgi:hypothetical protein|nr:hypothetical protein [Polyangiaceae bacterium]
MAGTNIEAREDAGEKSEWVRAHEALSLLAGERAAADAEEGRWLLAALRSAAHVHLGYGSFGEYIERLFGYEPRSTQEKLRVAESLEELPAIAQARASGGLNWSAVRELTRVAVAETESAWLDVARGKTVHQLEALVSGKSAGDGPSCAGRPDARRHVLRFEVAAETLALFREAMNKLKRSGTPLDDDSALKWAQGEFAQSTAFGRSKPSHRRRADPYDDAITSRTGRTRRAGQTDPAARQRLMNLHARDEEARRRSVRPMRAMAEALMTSGIGGGAGSATVLLQSPLVDFRVR